MQHEAVLLISSKLRPVLPIPSSIVVSQIPVDKWHQVIGDPTLADAICDRIVHRDHRIELKGRREGGQEEGSE
ncbi:hypothetical protein ES705_06764 [subsurface metagenome]